MSTRAKVATIGLLLLLLVSSSASAAIAPPNPPDRGAPTNNQSGPLLTAQPFTGGVFLHKDGSTNQNVSAKEFIVEFYCIPHPAYISKQFETGIGESISGPLTAAQASGVTEAENSVRPPRLVNLTITVGGLDLGGNLTYVMTRMTYNVTTYSVWVTSQESPPAEQRVGYVVVSVPELPTVKETSIDLSGSSCSNFAMSKSGPAWKSPALSLGNPLKQFSTPPQGGFAPILSYGIVEVHSSAGVAGAARITPGENMTFVLPPGKYKAVAEVALFGIPFGATLETFASPPGATTAQFTVSLNNMYGLWYGIELAALIIVVGALLALNHKLHLWGALVGASKYSLRGLRSAWRRFWD